MKHFITVIICMLAGCYTIFGQQPCTFNNGLDKYCIANISIVYDTNKFVVSGIEVNPTFQLTPGEQEPAIAIFIETGDGNFISKNLTPSASGSVDIYYQYPQLNFGYSFIAEATKNYDGGGPRRTILAPQTAIQTDPISGPVPYVPETFTSFTVRAFPNDIVQEDTITLAIMTGGSQYFYFYFQYDSRLVDAIDFGENFNKISESHSGTYTIQKFSVSDYGGQSGLKNTFIRIRPKSHFVATIPMGTDAPPFYFTTNSKLGNSLLCTTTLKVLASHDPNSINVAFCDFCPDHHCPRVSRRATRNQPITFHYTVDFENTGVNDEDSVRITYYCRIQNLKEEVKITNPVFAGNSKPDPPAKRLNIPTTNEGLQGRELVGTATYLFSDGILKGTSSLPYGHPLTQGSINFTIDSKKRFKDLSPDDRIVAWAEIKFESAGETIKTNEIVTSRKDFRKYYNRRCICQNTFILFRWICRLFKGI